MKYFVVTFFILHCVNYLTASNYLNNENSTLESIDLNANIINQSSVVYDNTNVTDTTIIITNETTTKDAVGKIDAHQDIHIDERFNVLSCDIPQLPSEYRIWKGNETYEMLIPKKVIY